MQYNSMTIIIQWQRGQYYLKLKELYPQGYITFIKDDLNVNPRTAARYTALAQILKDYPRICNCSLNMTEIVNYRDQIYDYLRKEESVGRALETKQDYFEFDIEQTKVYNENLNQLSKQDFEMS